MTIALWLRADRGITTVSGKVSVWADISVNANSLDQGTAALRPTYVNDGTGQGGRPYLDFVSADGTRLADTSFSGWPLGSGTYLAVVVNNTSTTGTQYACHFVTALGLLHCGRILMANGSAQTQGKVVLGVTDETTDAVASTTGAYVLEVFRSSVTDKLEIWRGGSRISATSGTVAIDTTGNLAGECYIGDAAAGGGLYDGHLYELVLANVDPTAAQLAQLGLKR